MPGFDGTGPQGKGAMTGGGRGYCAVRVDGNTPVAAQAGWPAGIGRGMRRGLGRGCGRGAGRGFRNQFYATGMPGWMRAQRGMQAFGQPPAQQQNIPPQDKAEGYGPDKG